MAARAWIAIGTFAFGRLAAVGILAVAPIAFGGVSVGFVAIGGGTLGLLAIGGLALGGVALGGLATGVIATGGLALAWTAASGDLAVAHDLAVGNRAMAAHSNDGVAQAFFAAHPWLDARHPVLRLALQACWVPAVLATLSVYWRRRHLLRPRRGAGAPKS